MIGTVDVSIQAVNPNIPLMPMMAYANSPSSLRLRDVPRKVGNWELTKVYFQATYPDGSIKSAICVKNGNIWVGTIDGSSSTGKSANGYTVFADGIDENGEDVTGYVLGIGDVFIVDRQGAIVPGSTVYYLNWYDEKPSAPKKGDFVYEEGHFQVFDGTDWTIEDFASYDDIPTKLSQLDNDKGYALATQIPTKVSELANDVPYAKKSELPTVPTKVSELENDSGYITSEGTVANADTAEQAYVLAESGSTGTATIEIARTKEGNTPVAQMMDGATMIGDLAYTKDIPTKTSQLTNDSDFTTKAYVDEIVGSIETILAEING